MRKENTSKTPNLSLIEVVVRLRNNKKVKSSTIHMLILFHTSINKMKQKKNLI